MAIALSAPHYQKLFSFLSGRTEVSRDSFPSFIRKGFWVTLVIALLLCLAMLGWAWVKGEETHAHLVDAIPQTTVLLDWNALAPLPHEAEDTAPTAQHPPPPNESSPPPASGNNTAAVASVALTPAPIEGLFENASSGRLPIIRTTDGLTPFLAYRRPFDLSVAAPSGTRGTISLVLLDMGLSDRATATAIKTFPPDVTLALSPYASQPDFWKEQSRMAGHEFWLTLPTSFPGTDPGPDVLTDSAGLETNLARLLSIMGQVTGYPGVLLTGEAGALASSTQGSHLREPIFTRGLALADLTPSPSQALEVAAIEAKIPYTNGAIRLDSDLRPAEILNALETLENKAIKEGSAVALLSPSPIGFQTVLDWIQSLPHKNLVLAPLSAQARQTEGTAENRKSENKPE